MSNSKTIEQFLSLLRAGLWNRLPDKELFDDKTDWATLFLISKQQTVAAIVWDGLERLNSELMPERKLRMEWYAYVMQVEKTNQMLNEKVGQVMDIYAKAGIDAVLIKGQSLAILYPNALHRGCGDIDIYVGRENYDKANQAMVRGGATNLSQEAEHHCHMTFGTIEVENHHRLSDFFTKKKAQRFEKLIPDKYEKATIGSSQVSVFPAQFNALFVFIHLYRHFFTFGVGLRQVCDWALLLHSNPGINPELIGHDKAWNTLAQMCVDHIGLAPENIPHYRPQNPKKSERMLAMILSDGNFGFNDTGLRTDRPKGYVAGKIFSFRKQTQRWLKLMRLLPTDTLQYIYGYKIRASIRQVKREKNL